MRREPLIFAFHDNKLYTFERTDQHSASVFGGPLQANLTGCPFGPKNRFISLRTCAAGTFPCLASASSSICR